MTGFEPATSCSQNRSATKLRYIPDGNLFVVYPFFSHFAREPIIFQHQQWWAQLLLQGNKARFSLTLKEKGLGEARPLADGLVSLWSSQREDSSLPITNDKKGGGVPSSTDDGSCFALYWATSDQGDRLGCSVPLNRKGKKTFFLSAPKVRSSKERLKINSIFSR